MTKFHFLFSKIEAVSGAQELIARYGNTPLSKADYIVALGGDGTLYEAFKKAANKAIPVVGFNIGGSKGFFMQKWNPNQIKDLPETIENLEPVTIEPLHVWSISAKGKISNRLAYADAIITYSSGQSLLLDVSVNGQKIYAKEKDTLLRCGGLITATQLGSTGANFVADGEILDLFSPLPHVAMTPFLTSKKTKPDLTGLKAAHQTRGCILFDMQEIKIQPLEIEKRPARIDADGQTANRNIKEVVINRTNTHPLKFLTNRALHLNKVKAL
ncbi:MAG: NAD(+)/NADH kinase [Lactobacillales bacterium]|jgi:NAD+ kinase|nr:NAD(+)/NADH kinase [Lactobacillales bacterium]